MQQLYEEIDNFDSQEDDMRPKRGEFGNTVNSTVLLPKKVYFVKRTNMLNESKKSL